MAQNESTASRPVAVETKQAGAPAEPQASAANSTKETEVRGFTDSQASPVQSRDSLAKTVEKNEASPKDTATDSARVPANEDAAPAKAAGAVAQPQPSYAPEPAAPPPPKTERAYTETRPEVAARQKEDADKKKDETAREQKGGRAREDDSQNQVAGLPAAKLGASVQSQEKPRAVARRASGAGDKANDEEAETRTVSGRRFRRQGTIWIDTAFQSSAATTSLSRGSEQFRALIADEPGLRDIAAQLPGEVIVVWKGRAYRIR